MNLNDLQQAWQQLNQTARIAPIRDAAHYDKMVQLADSLVEVIGDAKQHPLLDLLEERRRRIEEFELLAGSTTDKATRVIDRLSPQGEAFRVSLRMLGFHNSPGYLVMVEEGILGGNSTSNYFFPDEMDALRKELQRVNDVYHVDLAAECDQQFQQELGEDHEP